MAKVNVDGIQTGIGSYNNELEAAITRDKYIVKYLDICKYKLNFPEKIEDFKKEIENER